MPETNPICRPVASGISDAELQDHMDKLKRRGGAHRVWIENQGGQKMVCRTFLIEDPPAQPATAGAVASTSMPPPASPGLAEAQAVAIAAVAPSREGMVFPMHRRPADDYHTGARRFGSDRSGGRKHAGCDLYAPEGTEILAMADGEVIRGPYYFYSGTYALEVRHDDGTVVRYGEIKQTVPSGVEVGARVSRGQVIASVGLLDIDMSMLHLEMYRGTETGKLTQAGNEFKRRSDLVDPTPYLDAAPLVGEGPQVVGDGQDEMDRWVAALLEVETSGASARTAGQDRLEPGVQASRKMAETDLPGVVVIARRFADVAGKFGVPAAVLAAIASRESRCGRVLQNGWGDNDNAFGIMQVDKRHHEIDGLPDPTSVAHIEQAAGIFDDYLQQVMRKHPDWADAHLLKGTAAAYNFGVSNVQTIAGIDRGTTGDDYGSDVMARAQYYFDHPDLGIFRA